MKKYRFNKKADAFLQALYESVGATTDEQKYHTITLKLGYDEKNIGFSHNPTWAQKTAMMEYDLLEKEGLYQPIHV